MPIKINGATSGSVSLDAPATGSNVSLTLPGSVGTSGQLLSTNGAGVLSFVNGGKILQVVRATDTTARSTTSTSFIDAGISVTITPQRSDSAVLVYWLAYVESAVSNGNNTFSYFQITDNSNNPQSGAQSMQIGVDGYTRATTSFMSAGLALIAYATPATTSAVTYKGRYRSATGGVQVVAIGNSVHTGQMYAIEVSA